MFLLPEKYANFVNANITIKRMLTLGVLVKVSPVYRDFRQGLWDENKVGNQKTLMCLMFRELSFREFNKDGNFEVDFRTSACKNKQLTL